MGGREGGREGRGGEGRGWDGREGGEGSEGGRGGRGQGSKLYVTTGHFQCISLKRPDKCPYVWPCGHSFGEDSKEITSTVSTNY